eukprot:s1627_g14.t1
MAAYLITSQFLALLAPGFQNLSTVFIDSNYSRQVLSPLTAVIKGALARRLSESSAEVAQGAVTPVVLLVSALVAVHFANEMAFLLNLLGSFFCMNIAFVLPVVCYWRLTSDSLSSGRQFLFGLLIAMGLGGAVLGVISCL